MWQFGGFASTSVNAIDESFTASRIEEFTMIPNLKWWLGSSRNDEMMTRNDEKRGKRGKRGQDTADERKNFWIPKNVMVFVFELSSPADLLYSTAN